MKKIIYLLLFIPLFGFCQEKKILQKTLSLSDLVKEINDAQVTANNLVIEDCIIEYQSKKDNDLPSSKYSQDYKELVSKNAIHKISLTFDNCIIKDTHLRLHRYDLDSLNFYNCELRSFSMRDSCMVNVLNISNTQFSDFIYVRGSDISITDISRCKIPNEFTFSGNRLGSLEFNANEFLSTDINLSLSGNEFFSIEEFYKDANKPRFSISFIDDTLITYRIPNIDIYDCDFKGTLELFNNTFDDSTTYNTIKLYDGYHNEGDWSLPGPDSLSYFYTNKTIIRKSSGSWVVYNNEVPKIKDAIIRCESFHNNLTIRYSTFDEIRLENMTLNEIIISDNNFNTFYSSGVVCKGVIDFSENNIRSGGNIDFDILSETSIISVNTHKPNIYKYYSGDNNLKSHRIDSVINQLTLNKYNNDAYKKLVSTYIKLIGISKNNGDEQSTSRLIKKLRDIQTNRKKEEYVSNGSLDSYFNWRGNQFLKWFCEYGLNPFKGLGNCFKAIILFACIYFFFYSDWDKINRLFIVHKLNTTINYFATNKKIEDFYSGEHSNEILSFSELKKTLSDNKGRIPKFFITLSKPLYQVSFLRHRVINRLYKNIEFMAGRSWVDLNNKDKKLIGVLTFIIVLSYVTYLIIVRIINSIFLSINTFSTLGFGQIPVRGFIRYITILEGFLGWFLLSVFIVSLLNQMLQY